MSDGFIIPGVAGDTNEYELTIADFIDIFKNDSGGVFKMNRKLTDHHIWVKQMQTQRVRPAVQLFSAHNAGLMEACDPGPAGKAKRHCLETFNNWWDIQGNNFS